MNNLYLLYGAVGLVSGLYSSCWGSYKDSPFEKFSSKKFTRSLIAGSLLGIILFEFIKINGVSSPNLGIFFAFVMTFERTFTEFFKAFIRIEDQDKYKIPSTFHIFGKIIKNRSDRLIIGIILLVTIIFAFYMPVLLPLRFLPRIYGGFVWGMAAGLAIALGGAWKDAPMEGFFPVKFFRSPVIAGIWGSIFSLFTGNYSFIFFSCVGAERMTTELYKTFIKKNIPGKFKASEPLYMDWVSKRKIIVAPYVFAWIIFSILLLYEI